MFEVEYKSPEIEARSVKNGKIFVTAELPKPHTLFQAQSILVKTGIAIKSDQSVIAVPTPENNKLGLVFGYGIEVIECDGSEIELTVWNRNVPGQQRQVEIVPGMELGYLMVMPAAAAKRGRKPAEKDAA